MTRSNKRIIYLQRFRRIIYRGLAYFDIDTSIAAGVIHELGGAFMEPGFAVHIHIIIIR
jgi:hypothetical protein